MLFYKWRIKRLLAILSTENADRSIRINAINKLGQLANKSELTSTDKVAKLVQEWMELDAVPATVKVGSHEEEIGGQPIWGDGYTGFFSPSEIVTVDDYGSNPAYDPAHTRMREIENQLAEIAKGNKDKR